MRDPVTHRRARQRVSAAALGLLLAIAVPAAGSEAPRAPASPAPDYLLDEPDARELSSAEVSARPGLFPAAKGERLVYDVSYLGVPVGSLSMEVARFLAWRGLRLAHVVCIARANDVFSRLYPIYDQTEAWIEIDSMRTLRARSYTSRGRKETYYDLRLDWDAHFLHLLYEQRHKGKVRELSFDFGPYVHHIIDLVYQLRRAPLRPGFSASVPVYASRKVYEIRVSAGPPAPLDLGALGRIEAIPLSSETLQDGKVRSGGDDRLWVSADGAPVPLRLEGWPGVSKGFFGNGVRAELVSRSDGAPGWTRPRVPAWEPPRWSFESERGMPRWRAPESIETIRRARGLEYRNATRRVERDSLPPPPIAAAASRSR